VTVPLPVLVAAAVLAAGKSERSLHAAILAEPQDFRERPALRTFHLLDPLPVLRYGFLPGLGGKESASQQQRKCQTMLRVHLPG
jgi:hypothetical protein